MVGLQTQLDLTALTTSIPQLGDLPVIPIHVMDADTLYSVLEWQKIGARTMIRCRLILSERNTWDIGTIPAPTAHIIYCQFFFRNDHLLKTNLARKSVLG